MLTFSTPYWGLLYFTRSDVISNLILCITFNGFTPLFFASLILKWNLSWVVPRQRKRNRGQLCVQSHYPYFKWILLYIRTFWCKKSKSCLTHKFNARFTLANKENYAFSSILIVCINCKGICYSRSMPFKLYFHLVSQRRYISSIH